MKFDFDTFEFAGLIAPGSVIVLAFTLYQPQILRMGEPAVVIALAIIAAYLVGHLAAAVGNAAKPLFRLVGIHSLAVLSNEQWSSRGYIAADQWDRLGQLVRANLHRKDPIEGAGSIQRTTVVKQMYLAVMAASQPQRLTTFDGLYSLSRGLAISFIICVPIMLIARQYAATCLCVVAACLALFRMRKFNNHYHKELIQQFLMLDEKPII